MAFEDLKLDQLRSIASEHGIEGYTSLNKSDLIDALVERGVDPPDTTGGGGEALASAVVSGFQQGIAYPMMPRTPDQFATLLENPDLPAANQSAPSPEKLNPHIYPVRLP
jgi:hypothetical protein